MVTSHAKYHNVSVENMSFTVINSPRLIYNKEHISSISTISRDAYGILDKDVLASLSCVLEFSTGCDMDSGDSGEGYNASGFHRTGIHTFSRRLFIVIYLSSQFLPVVLKYVFSASNNISLFIFVTVILKYM